MSYAMVPYAGRAAAAAAFRYNRRNVAKKLTNHVFQNRRAYASAAGKVARFVSKTYRRRKRMQKSWKSKATIGKRRGEGTTKWYSAFELQSVSQSTRTLYQQELTLVPMQASHDKPEHTRERNACYVSGVKINFAVSNNDANKQLLLNVAIVQPKHQGWDSGTGLIASNNFFRAAGNLTDTRATDFATDLSSMHIHRLPLNVDQLQVYSHKRYRLGKLNANDSRGTVIEFNRWFPVKRQIRYDSGVGADSESPPVFLVWWTDQLHTAASTVPQANKMTTSVGHTLYFRPVKQ